MQAMDAELSRRSGRSVPPVREPGGADTSTDMDIEAAMEAELQANLRTDGDAEDEGQEGLDYNLIKNFLESFKSQAGLSGPVSNLAGQLHPAWGLPRDAS